MVYRGSIAQWAQKVYSGGPTGGHGQYGGVNSRVVKRTLHPVWKFGWLELKLHGGVMNADGEYDNPEAPYTKLRLEVWDHDVLSRDDFIGEVTIPLCPLMDARTHAYTLELSDPEGKSGAPEAELEGATISFECRYES